MDPHADLALIAEQERQLVFDRFDEDTAWRLGTTLRDRAVAEAMPVVIDIQAFGRSLFVTALPGSAPENHEWVRRKRSVAAHFHHSSYAVGLDLAVKGQTVEEPHGLRGADHAAHGGAFPLRLRGSGVVGFVTVSRLPQREDHRVVVRALCAVLGVDAAPLELA